MKVELEKTFPMPADADTVWAFLQNIEGVAGCMPGARITERVDDKRYKGTVAVRVGPASMAFKGELEVRELDESHRTLRLIGKGADSTGTSGASMDLTVRIETGDVPDASQLIGKSEVSMSGKAATFGGRMMGTVADQILKQFAANFADEVRTLAAKHANADARAAMPAGSALATQSGIAIAPDSALAPVTHGAAAPVRALNVVSLVWAIVRDWVRRWFARKPA